MICQSSQLSKTAFSTRLQMFVTNRQRQSILQLLTARRCKMRTIIQPVAPSIRKCNNYLPLLQRENDVIYVAMPMLKILCTTAK